MSALLDSPLGPVNITSLVLISFSTLLIAGFIWSQKRPAKNFPPGPNGWPVIGNILDFNEETPLQVFERLGKTYGDIFSIRIGQMWTVVFNSTDVIKEALLKKGVEFADRPRTYSTDLFTYGGKDITFGQFTPTWKLHRKLVHSAFRTLVTGDNERFESIIYEVISRMETVIEQKKNQPFEPKPVVALAVYNFLASMCFGKSYEFDNPDLLEWMELSDESMKVANGLPADYIPILSIFPTKGARMIQDIANRFIKLVEKEFREHRKNYDGGEPKDFVDLLFKTKEEIEAEGSEKTDLITDTHMKMTVLDVFIAGTDTTIQTLTWCVGLLAEYPEVQARVAKEIDDVIGRDRKTRMDDRGTLPYTEATLYEVFRYSSLVPLALPHATQTDVEIGGYLIPKGITCLFNLQAMHFDKNHWDEPEKFKPEHFLDEAGSLRLHPIAFMPFSGGRRVCVGESVAKAELFLLFTWLFQHYTFRKTPEKENISIDRKMETVFGNFIEPYEVIAKKRF